MIERDNSSNKKEMRGPTTRKMMIREIVNVIEIIEAVHSECEQVNYELLRQM